MTYGELFREVYETVTGVKTGAESVLADSVAPDTVKKEVPPEYLDDIRAALIKTAMKIEEEIKEKGYESACRKYLTGKLTQN